MPPVSRLDFYLSESLRKYMVPVLPRPDAEFWTVITMISLLFSCRNISPDACMDERDSIPMLFQPFAVRFRVRSAKDCCGGNGDSNIP